MPAKSKLSVSRILSNLNGANLLTALRVLCSVSLLFCIRYSVRFWVLYGLAGLSDILDGYVARKWHCVTDFGSLFDTIADFIFAAAIAILILPTLVLPLWLILAVIGIAIAKLLIFLFGWHKIGHPTVLHTPLNKICGGLLFLFPITTAWISLTMSGGILCVLCIVATMQEGIAIFTTHQK